MTLEAQIDANRQNIRSDGYAMSIGEVLNLYRDHEIVIQPEFQRLFRWPIEKQSRLIESLLLDIPLPAIFVSQAQDSTWEVVDGLQRLSTILLFVGELRDESTGEVAEPSQLTRTKYLPDLEGATYQSLSPEVRLRLKRARVDFRILLKESDEKVKFELFDRLNSGGVRTSPQEVRTAMLLMQDKSFFDALQSLRFDPSVSDTLSLSDRQLVEQYDLELLVRFLSFQASSQIELGSFSDIDTFLSDKMVEMGASGEAYWAPLVERARAVFNVAASAGPAAFRKFDSGRMKSTGGFSVSAFEAVTAGLAAHLGAWQALPSAEQEATLMDCVATLWQDSEFQANSGAGVRATTRAPRMPAVGARIFRL